MRDFTRYLRWTLTGLILSACTGVAQAEDAVAYGPHGGVIHLAPGAYVCVVNDEAVNRCLVRAITEDEIAAARKADEEPTGSPMWMQASFNGEPITSVPVPGLPLDNVFGLPGLMTEQLDAGQVLLVRCLAGTKLGRMLVQWDDPVLYRRGIVEQCEHEAAANSLQTAAVPDMLPIPANPLQEAAIIRIAMQQLADANALYSSYAGRFATSTLELVSGPILGTLPRSTPSMSRIGFVIAPSNRIVVELRPESADVCRALNLLEGRYWLTVMPRLPPGARAGCYPTSSGYRFEYQG